MVKMRLLGETTSEKLRLNYRIEGECWRWNGAHIPTGYGQIWADGKLRAVHQLAHEHWIGPIPDGLEIDHLCNTRDCINPKHLEAVTHAENLTRKRARRTHCVRGHEITAANTLVERDGHKHCRVCRRADQKAYKARRRARKQDAAKGDNSA